MAAAAMKHIASGFSKLEKFTGVDFIKWQEKMHYMLSSMSVVYVLTTPMPKDGGDNPTVEQVRKRAKWNNDDYVCRVLILNSMFDFLFDIYQNVDTSKELWDTLEAKYMVEDASKLILIFCPKVEMSRDVLIVGSIMRIPLLYRGEYSQWVKRFMNYLEEQTYGEAMINSIKDGDQPLPRVTQVNKTAKDLWDALARHMLGLEYGEQDTKAAVLSKEKVVVSSDSEGSEADDFSELKKIKALLAKAFNRRKFYSKPTNNNLRTSSSSQSANKKQEFVKTDNKRVEKKDDEKKRDMSRVKCYNCKKEGHFAKDYQEINANMVFMAQIKKVLSDLEASSSSANEKISEVSNYLSEFESESEFETSEYYDNSTNYSLFVNNDDDQEIFHDATDSASEKFIENHVDFQKDYDKSDVDHNDPEEKNQLVDKLIRKFNKKIVKCQNRVEKANQQSKDFENQNKDLQDKYNVLKNQTTNFEMNNKELNEQLIELIEKNNDLLTQMKLLKEQLQVKHVLIDTHVECHEKYAKL
nr:zinc finger, CCHC-type [Tanacetum cinerariifolium]